MDLPMSTLPEPVDPKTTRPRIRTVRITMLEHAPTTLRSDPFLIARSIQRVFVVDVFDVFDSWLLLDVQTFSIF